MYICASTQSSGPSAIIATMRRVWRPQNIWHTIPAKYSARRGRWRHPKCDVIPGRIFCWVWSRPLFCSVQSLTVLVIGERRGSKSHQQERDHRLHSVSIGGRRGAEQVTRSHWPVVPGAPLCTVGSRSAIGPPGDYFPCTRRRSVQICSSQLPLSIQFTALKVANNVTGTGIDNGRTMAVEYIAIESIAVASISV